MRMPTPFGVFWIGYTFTILACYGYFYTGFLPLAAFGAVSLFVMIVGGIALVLERRQ